MSTVTGHARMADARIHVTCDRFVEVILNGLPPRRPGDVLRIESINCEVQQAVCMTAPDRQAVVVRAPFPLDWVAL